MTSIVVGGVTPLRDGGEVPKIPPLKVMSGDLVPTLTQSTGLIDLFLRVHPKYEINLSLFKKKDTRNNFTLLHSESLTSYRNQWRSKRLDNDRQLNI